jgi:hypothetical protein
MKQAPFFGLRCLPRERAGIMSGVLLDLWIIVTSSGGRRQDSWVQSAPTVVDATTPFLGRTS